MNEAQADFCETLELIKKGGDVTRTELDTASAYANSTLKEAMSLLAALLSGYKALQDELARKNQVIEARNRRIHSLNELLAETNRMYRAAKAALQEGGLHGKQ